MSERFGGGLAAAFVVVLIIAAAFTAGELIACGNITEALALTGHADIAVTVKALRTCRP